MKGYKLNLSFHTQVSIGTVCMAVGLNRPIAKRYVIISSTSRKSLVSEGAHT